MGKIWILGQYYLSFCVVILVHLCDSQEPASNTYTISSFTYPTTHLRPYDWRYIRVELPPWFSSMSLALESDTEVDPHKINNASSLPMICIREGSHPLPDVYNTSQTGLVIGHISNDSFLGTKNLQNAEKCYPMQKNIWLRVTNEQISSGVWFFGLFNGIGPIRTQSKMINRGSGYSFSGNVSVEGCMTATMSGQFCNQTVNMLSCNDSNNSTGIDLEKELYKRMGKNVIACRDANGVVCHDDNTPKIYSLDVMGIVEELFVTAANVTFSGTQNINQSLMCYVRHGALPSKTNYDFAGDISKAPLVVSSPKVGRWYITVQLIDILNKSEVLLSNSSKVCYLLEWQVFQCPLDKAGVNCTFERYALQAVIRRSMNVPFESSYVPITGKVPQDSPNFPLEPLLSNVSTGKSNNNDAWTFFLLDIPYGATGENLHVNLDADSKINYELYARYGGLPSLDTWDYFYANTTSSSNGSMFFKLYDASEKKVNFYLLYVRGGTWGIGLRQLNRGGSMGKTSISLSLERCPERCSSHGSCQMFFDTSGLTLFSYCFCDRNHGGFDCSVELVSHRGHIRQSIFLIVSNIAAVLPAYWSLRNKAFAEWVLFTFSGTSSALYHACDVGTWCVLSFRVLQFFDFWLSFMAVVSTFVYLATISELQKRTIHTLVAIFTALLAEMGPTRSRNIAVVFGIGSLALLVGWLIEHGIHYRSFSFSMEFHMNLLIRWENIKAWINNIIKTILRRYRWGFIVAGFTALVLASVSWAIESTETYWIWHSLWHLFIYTSSFLFLCSKAKVESFEHESTVEAGYELTRQNSFTQR